MADRWRRQTLASWEVLLDFDHATMATYAYLATGPAATKTGCVRIHKRRLRRELGLKGTQVDAVLADLLGGGLIAMSAKGDVLTIYLCGMLCDCPPSTANIRRGYIKEIASLGVCDATSRALSDLSETGGTDLQVVEHTGGRLSLMSQQSPIDVAHKRIEEKRREESRTEETPLQGAEPSAPTQAGEDKPKKLRKRKPTLAQNPPTFESLHTYAIELEYTDDALHDFIDYWTSMGWERKGGPCRDARAMMRSNKRMRVERGFWKKRGGVTAATPSNPKAASLPEGWS